VQKTLKLTYEHLYVEKIFRLASTRIEGQIKKKREGGEGRGERREGREGKRREGKG
jgi:hypothetical protein